MRASRGKTSRREASVACTMRSSNKHRQFRTFPKRDRPRLMLAPPLAARRDTKARGRDRSVIAPLIIARGSAPRWQRRIRMARLRLRLSADFLPESSDPVFLPAAERALYVMEGAVTVEWGEGARLCEEGGAFLGDEAIALLPGPAGARLLRFELAQAEASDRGQLRAAPAAASEQKL